MGRVINENLAERGIYNLTKFTEDCMICGKPLIYSQTDRIEKCYICGIPNSTNTTCEDGHYICDSCHSEEGVLLISIEVVKSTSINPVEMAAEIMRQKEINIHGPEHHYLVVAVLLVAYKNAGGIVDLESALQIARQRTKNVYGGICGLWGSCGAGIATGIFISIITKATPLSEKEWSLANEMTSQSLHDISKNGGPRCCKRNTNLAIYRAVDFVKANFNIYMELPNQTSCEFTNMRRGAVAPCLLYNVKQVVSSCKSGR